MPGRSQRWRSLRGSTRSCRAGPGADASSPLMTRTLYAGGATPQGCPCSRRGPHCSSLFLPSDPRGGQGQGKWGVGVGNGVRVGSRGRGWGIPLRNPALCSSEASGGHCWSDPQSVSWPWPGTLHGPPCPQSECPPQPSMAGTPSLSPCLSSEQHAASSHYHSLPSVEKQMHYF